jgi:hypothetical protein
MKSEIIVQFTGSKTNHRPHPFNEGTLCGRKGGSEWTTGYYGTYGEVTCKSCIRIIPQVMWNAVTSPYKYADYVSTVTCKSLYSSREGGAFDEGMHSFWMPSRDGDTNGMLVIWDEWFQTWSVLTKEGN